VKYLPTVEIEEEQKENIAYFTGLYALWRPFWLDSEDDGIKTLENPKTAPFFHGAWGGYMGEDTYLKYCMDKKHDCVFLPDVGATDFGVGLEETKGIQLKIGKFSVLDCQRPTDVFVSSILYVRPHAMGSYMHHLALVYGGSFKAFLVAMEDILNPWLYWCVRKLLRLFVGKDRAKEIMVAYMFDRKIRDRILYSLEARLKERGLLKSQRN